MTIMTADEAQHALRELQQRQHEVRPIFRGLESVEKILPFIETLISGTQNVANLAAQRDALQAEIEELMGKRAAALISLSSLEEMVNEERQRVMEFQCERILAEGQLAEVRKTLEANPQAPEEHAP